MDEEIIPRQRRQRPKDSFQNELQAKLHQRKYMGLSADITDSEDDTLGQVQSKDFRKTRPASAKRRQDSSPDLSRGLGTTTMRSRDLTQLMGRDGYDDDDDEEIMAANLGRSSPGGSWQPGSKKTPSPKMDTLYGRKTPTAISPKDSGKLESIFGRKTPNRESSPKSDSLSKEDIIFGRKTPVDGRKTPVSGKKSPVDGKKSPLDGKKSPLDGKKSPMDGSMQRLPGMDDRQWHPPNYRSASPGSDQSRGSRGVTPIDSTLDTISERPRDKAMPRVQRGQRSDISPRQLALDERPKPQARSRVTGGKTSPLTDQRRVSPTSPRIKDGGMKRTSPSMDLFGGLSRVSAAQEVEEYIEKGQEKDKLRHGRMSTSPEGQKKTSGRVSPGKQTSGGRFTKDGRKTPTDRKSPSFDRKTTTGFGKISNVSKDKRDPEQNDEEIFKQKAAAMKEKSLLDFLTEDGTASKPEPKERGKSRKDTVDDDIDSIFASNKRLLDSQSPKRKNTNKTSAESIGEVFEPISSTINKPRPEDTSSICEEVPLDPNKKASENGEKIAKSSKQTTERVQADAAIDAIAGVQTMQFIEPAKKIRPVTASAKVEHRPKPRYGTPPGETKPVSAREFNSTGDIREAIYEDWYKERIKAAKIKKREEEKKKKEKEEKEQKEKQEKRLESEASYRCWMEKKKEKILEEEAKQKKLQKQKEQKEKEEKREKFIEAEKSYHYWKEKKDQMIKNNLRKKQEEEKEQKENEEYEKRMKNKERESVYKGWQKRKEKEFKNMSQKKKEMSKSKKQLELEDQQKLKEKEEEAMDRYYEWMEQKEKQAKLEKKREKMRRMTGEDLYKPAWSPASKTIPFGR